MPEPLCCATLHVVVLSCVEDRPVDNSEVTAVGPTGTFEVTYAGFTDDTGTVTLLVEEEGEYTITATHANFGEKTVTVMVECGVPGEAVPPTVIGFGFTDKICFEVDISDGLPPDTEITVTKVGEGTEPDEEVGGCVVGISPSRCCVDIPGPGTYTFEGDSPGTTFATDTLVVKDTDCGAKVIQVVVPTAAPTCEKIIHVEQCGCPATGVGISVAIPQPPTGDYIVSGTSNTFGDAYFTVPESLCDNWAGSPYTIAQPGDDITGTVSGDGMTVTLPNPAANHYCYPTAPTTCTGARPGTLYFTLGGTGWPAGVGGTVAVPFLELSGGSFYWQTACMPKTGGGYWRVGARIPQFPADCDGPVEGGFAVGVYNDEECENTFGGGVWSFDFNSPYASGSPICPTSMTWSQAYSTFGFSYDNTKSGTGSE